MDKKPRPVDLITVPTGSVALDRLIAEVRAEDETGVPRGYNRTYTRHNRS